MAGTWEAKWDEIQSAADYCERCAGSAADNACAEMYEGGKQNFEEGSEEDYRSLVLSYAAAPHDDHIREDAEDAAWARGN